MNPELVTARLDEAANEAWLKFDKDGLETPMGVMMAFILGFKCGSIFGHTLAEEIVNRKEES